MQVRFLVSILLVLCFINACTQSETQDCEESESLFSFADFPIGVAVSLIELEQNSTYRHIIIEQFNSITPGNAFKPEALQPLEGAFEFEAANNLLEFATDNHKTVHGHTLIWHQQLPSWMEHYNGSRNDWIEMMKNHIQTIVGQLKVRVKSWDVVNEAFEDNGDFRETIWYNNIGSEYIELAFEFAHEADPTAKLFYNDYNLAAKSKKCKAVLEHFFNLKQKGLAVHGIGMQMHVFSSSPNNNKIRKATSAFAEAGFLIRYSEVDISMNTNGEDMKLNNKNLEKQAAKMRDLVDIFQSIPSHQQHGITVWGLSDKDSWIPSYFNREDYPLLYDDLYKPKPMYCAFIEGLIN